MTAETVYSIFSALSDKEKERFCELLDHRPRKVKKEKRKTRIDIKMEQYGFTKELLYDKVLYRMRQAAKRRNQKLKQHNER